LPTTLRGGTLIARIPKPLSPSKVGIRVSAVDPAGNAVTSLVTSMSLSTRTGKHFHKVRHARARVPYGRAVQLAGRLTTTDGVPIAHQPIAVTGVLRRTGAGPEPVTTAVTDTNGRFRFSVPAGPSRTLTVAYAGNAGVLRRARTASLRVPARATIRAGRRVLHGTGRVRFHGRLKTLGAALPPGGKIVELQAAQRGHWTTVATTRAKGPKAAWHARARFRGTPGRYPVRLRIRREAAFPYERGYSRAVPVRVR
ncbi:MAG TPA: hypothetical protein VFG79_08325, partial [Solirubrobacter sp.]|nr:hypothetical protein [Solirubrobacter sp.]